MRIAFVAGCLERGHDGVGDYTRTLAAECARRGHEVALLAVGEPKPVANVATEPWPMRRLTGAEWRGDSGAAARRWLEAFGPDGASLQFVPYSFDPRGFFAASIPALATTLGAAARRHVFFHEIWIGSQRGAPLKARMFGGWQRRAVKKMLRVLAPHRVHTSNDYYRAALATLGTPAGKSPVFGNVPMPVHAVEAEAIPGIDPRALVCGMFGTVHPDWEPDRFLADFAALAAGRGRPAALVAVGGMGYGTVFFEKLAVRWRGRVTCVALGRCDEARLARVFGRFDFAVTSVPWNILGKSSSAAALREHGLTVVVTAAGTPPRFASPPPAEAPGDNDGFLRFFQAPEKLALAAEKKTPARPGVEAVAEVFLEALK